MSNISVHSEIGKLNTVIVHQPGNEMENMTPATAKEVLYDDILNLDLALAEHRQLTGVLRRVAKVHEFTDLLCDVLKDDKVKLQILKDVCNLYGHPELIDDLAQLEASALSAQFFAGTLLEKNTLERFLSDSRHAIPPLPNAFFTRDAVMCVYENIIIGSMAHKVRLTEALLLRYIFRHHPLLGVNNFYHDGTRKQSEEVTVEGGDILVIKEDLLIIGFSGRTSARAIDKLAKEMSRDKGKLDILVVKLPKIRATIHLDMIFTMLDVDKFMVFPPLITGPDKCRSFHMVCSNGSIKSIKEFSGLPKAMRSLGIEATFINCGGNKPFAQEREQWTSGANFFTFAPGHIIGYKHNKETMLALDKAGFEIITANDIITDKKSLDLTKLQAISMDGAELSRGGGGCRCMTMPVHRDSVSWS
ncbi:MAG: arginine deiminase family protein [Proteobacteria bacterium]|nr:arginine deiminase family protein [Pseudomonadota bacterium]